MSAQRGIEKGVGETRSDIENANNSGFQSFIPEAEKLDIHKEGSLDAFFSAFDSGSRLVLADLAGGSSNAAKAWFEEAAD